MKNYVDRNALQKYTTKIVDKFDTIYKRSADLDNKGIGNVVHSNWDNSVSILQLSNEYNGMNFKVDCTPSSYPSSMPSALQGVTAVCMREQFASMVSSSGTLHAVVVLWEVYPINGRMWINAYNASAWIGWREWVPEARWGVTGNILSNPSGSALGYGRANIFRQTNGIYRIEWEAAVSTADSTATSEYAFGPIASAFTSTVGKTITPISGYGHWEEFSTSGVYNYTHAGYASYYNASTTYGIWALARIYNTSGGNGSWAVSSFTSGTKLKGVCYGT